MNVQVYEHDLRAQDPPCLNDTNSLKDPCTMPWLWPCQRAGITQASHTSVPGKWAKEGLVGARAWCCMSLLFCLSNVITPLLSLEPWCCHHHPVGSFRIVGMTVPCSPHKPDDI